MKPKMVSAYMDIAFRMSHLSSAKRLQVGSIIVKDDRILSIGYNGTPSGWDNMCEDPITGLTIPEVIHSEMNSISKLAKSNESGLGSIMFVTHSPCISCAKGIYGAGIKEVYYTHPYKDMSGVEFLKKCGINVIQYGD